MIETDVVIAGSGPAGLSCAISLGMKGISCLLLEKRSSLSGKVCGDGLTVRAIRDLDRLGIDPLSLEGAKVFYKTVFRDGVAQKRSFKELFGFEYEYGVSRDLLDNCLLEKALFHGAQIRYGTPVYSVEEQGGGYVVNGELRCRQAVLACGALGTPFIKESPRPGRLPAGVSARVMGSCSLSHDSFYYYYDREKYGNGYAWIFPVGQDKWNIGVFSSDIIDLKGLYKLHEKSFFPEGVQYDRAPGGALIGAVKEPSAAEGPLLRIGDCALSADFGSGEGISMAIEDGIEAAGRIIESL